MNKNIIELVGKCLGIGTSVAVIVLNILNKLQVEESITLLSIGLLGISISLLQNNSK